MSRRHRRKHRSPGNVELNLAAMLDMAFQLLAFFILTFKPSPVEGQLALNMPPPVPLTKVEAPPPEPPAGEGAGDLSALMTLPIFVTADGTGGVSEVRVGSVPVVRGGLDDLGVARLDSHLKSTVGADIGMFERIQVSADGGVRYGEVMKALDVCHRQKGPDGKPFENVSIVETSGTP